MLDSKWQIVVRHALLVIEPIGHLFGHLLLRNIYNEGGRSYRFNILCRHKSSGLDQLFILISLGF